MRKILIAVALAGCVHPIPRSPQEYCAAQGMVADGFASTSSGATGYATDGQHGAVVTSRGYAQSVSCRRPTSAEEQCEVAIAAASGAPKIGNEDVRGRNLLIATGYFFFLLPGVVFYFAFNSGIESAQRNSVEAGDAARSRCGP